MESDVNQEPSNVVKGVCDWACRNELERDYHDREWGIPVFDDQTLFEFLTLEGAQAGLSWLIVLKKRAHYQLAFDHYDLERLAQYDETRVDDILSQYDVIRHRGKVLSVFTNAKAALALQSEFGSLRQALWQFVDHQPVINQWKSASEVPVSTETSKEMSRFLKRRGFKFVGETICYSFMQAVGMVNDHLITCPCYSHSEGREGQACS